MLEELEEGLEPMRWCEEKEREWARHWHCESEAQAMEEKLWRNEELRSFEEGLQKLKEESFQEKVRGHYGSGL